MYARRERFNSQCNEFENSIIVKELNIQLKIEYIFFAVKTNLIRAVNSKTEAEVEKKGI